MFFRKKAAKGGNYLQLVESYREGRRVRQRVLLTLGRAEEMERSGRMDALLASAARFARKSLVLSAHERGEAPVVSTVSIGAALAFERLWTETGIREILKEAAGGRQFSFSLERAVFLTVLHRLCAPGSDRAAEHWREGQRIEGTEDLDLHHLYRAMAWLGEALPDSEQRGATPFAPRCEKDLVEERLFERRRHLFSSLSLVFFDTTSIYFEGEGGEELGRYGHSKDHRPDLRQMAVGVVLDQDGNPLMSESWPGNVTDVKSLLPVLRRLKARFKIEEVCLVSDRGMVSEETLLTLEAQAPKVRYILGARMRRNGTVRDDVLSRAGRFKEVFDADDEEGRSPLKVKEVLAQGRRYIVCANEEQAEKDRRDRALILESLEKALKRGDKALIGNRGYRKYLKSPKGRRLSIDCKKVAEEERYDGKWVLVTNLDVPASEAALQYKRLWMVEAIFRTMKSTLRTRPIYHKRDETIRGHVFCSFLALVLRKALEDSLAAAGKKLEWQRVIGDLGRVTETTISIEGNCFVLRGRPTTTASTVFQALHAALPPTLREASYQAVQSYPI